MDQGAGRFPGHRSRHRLQRSAAQAPGRSRRRLAVGGKRERSDAACRAPRLGGRSDRRHARLHRRPRGLVGVGGAGGRWPAGGRRVVRAGDRRTVPCDRGRRRDAQRRRDPGQFRRQPRRRPRRRAQDRCSIGSLQAGPELSRCRASIRWRCGWPGWRTASSTPRWPAATATTGTLRLPTFWCTKPAA